MSTVTPEEPAGTPADPPSPEPAKQGAPAQGRQGGDPPSSFSTDGGVAPGAKAPVGGVDVTKGDTVTLDKGSSTALDDNADDDDRGGDYLDELPEPPKSPWQINAERWKQKVKIRELPRMLVQATKFVWDVARGFFLISIGLQVLSATGAAATLLASKDALSVILNAAETGADLGSTLPKLAPVALVAVFNWIMRTVQMLQNGYVQERVTMLAQGRLLRTAKAVDLGTFEDPEFFDLLQRAQSGTMSGWQLVMSTVGMFGNVLTIAAVVGTLYTFHPMLVVMVVLAGIPVFLTSHRNARKNYDLNRDLIGDFRRLHYYWEILTGRDQAKEMRAFDLGPDVERRWQELNKAMIRRRRRLAIETHFRSSAGSILSGSMNAVAVGFALWLLLSGRIPTAAAGAALYGIQAMRGQVAGVLTGITGLYSTGLFLNDYNLFLEIGDAAIKSHPAKQPAGPFKTLEVQDITFQYPGSKVPAVRNVSATINAGEIIALVGENGSGKTTLAKILAQLYIPTEGRILWDGVDTRELNPSGMRDSIAVIFQDFVKYHLSAQENIGFGRIEYADNLPEVVESSRRAGADRFLSKLPEGYETLLTRVYGHGRDLSIGQWQRVALARAFFRDAQFIILDEPTAALDPRAEHDLFDKIRQLCAGRTVLLISHRFSSVRNADRIYVLEQGRVVEDGTHEELMRNGGLYAELFTMQASAYLDGLKLNEVAPNPV